MNHNGFIASTNLDFSDFKNDINHSFDTTAATNRSPVGDVKLAKLLNPFSLREKGQAWSHTMHIIVGWFIHSAANLFVDDSKVPDNKSCQFLFSKLLNCELSKGF